MPRYKVSYLHKKEPEFIDADGCIEYVEKTPRFVFTRGNKPVRVIYIHALQEHPTEEPAPPPRPQASVGRRYVKKGEQ